MFKLCSFQIADVEKVKKCSAYSFRSLKYFNFVVLQYQMVAWPSGLRRWFKAPVSSGAWVRIPPLPLKFFLFFTFNVAVGL